MISLSLPPPRIIPNHHCTHVCWCVLVFQVVYKFIKPKTVTTMYKSTIIHMLIVWIWIWVKSNLNARCNDIVSLREDLCCLEGIQGRVYNAVNHVCKYAFYGCSTGGWTDGHCMNNAAAPPSVYACTAAVHCIFVISSSYSYTPEYNPSGRPPCCIVPRASWLEFLQAFFHWLSRPILPPFWC